MSKNLRTTFDGEAELYHAIRPRYPEALFSALITTAGLQPDARLLEIGPGTGQATEPLARRGFPIIAIELGSELARVATKALESYSNVRIINTSFEAVQLPPVTFDLVYAATALHWIDAEYRFRKPHQLLKPGGYLAVIDTVHVSDDAEDRFFFASQPVYKRHTPTQEFREDFRPSRLGEVKASTVDKTLFTPVFFKVFPQVIRYSAEEYAQLLNTYSPTLAMEPQQRAEFLGEIQQLIEEEFSGSLLKHFAMALTIAKKNE